MSNQRKANLTSNNNLLPIPDKLYFAIGEVAKLCELQAHVIRYWEQEFSQLCPSKRRGNRRYYTRKDVILIRKIKDLLYKERFTIPGARHQLELLRLSNVNEGTVEKTPKATSKPATISTDGDVRDALQRAVVGLEGVLFDLTEDEN